MSEKKRRLVLIEWVDSYSSDRWMRLDDVPADPLYCRTVGWFVSRSKTTTSVVASISGERNGDIVHLGCGQMSIPNKAILRIRTIRCP